jgi:predicted Zn-dependent protease with MMP-like domain
MRPRPPSSGGAFAIGYDQFVDLSTFEQVVQTVLDELPPWVAAEMENVAVVVEHRPTRMQDPQAGGILGIYEGVPLPDRGFDYFGVAPDRTSVFYLPHQQLSLSDSELAVEIRTTVLHEIGHHLGLSDARLHKLGWS